MAINRILLQNLAPGSGYEKDTGDTPFSPFEPAHEIMVLFVLRKLILQTRMHSYPVGLDV